MSLFSTCSAQVVLLHACHSIPFTMFFVRQNYVAYDVGMMADFVSVLCIELLIWVDYLLSLTRFRSVKCDAHVILSNQITRIQCRNTDNATRTEGHESHDLFNSDYIAKKISSTLPCDCAMHDAERILILDVGLVSAFKSPSTCLSDLALNW